MFDFLFEKREIIIASVVAIPIIVLVIVKANELLIEFLVWSDFIRGFKYYKIDDYDCDAIRQYSVVRVQKHKFPNQPTIHPTDAPIGDMAMILRIGYIHKPDKWVRMRVRKYRN